MLFRQCLWIPHAVLDLSHWTDATLDLLELFVLFMHYQVMNNYTETIEKGLSEANNFLCIQEMTNWRSRAWLRTQTGTRENNSVGRHAGSVNNQ